MKNVKLIGLGLVLLTSGCATQRYQPPPKVVEAANTPVICEGKEACDVLWAKAQIWVSQNAGYKIQVATDSVVETFSARDYSQGYSVRLTKMPLGEGKFELSIAIGCGYPALCEEQPIIFQARFRRDLIGMKLN